MLTKVVTDIVSAFEKVSRDMPDSEDEGPRPSRRPRRSKAKPVSEPIKSVSASTSIAPVNISLSPVRTSTPSKGYDGEESQTQMLEDPFLTYNIERGHSRKTESKKVMEEVVPVQPLPKQLPRTSAVMEKADKLIDLNVQLALLVVKNHRKGLNAYKTSKSSGIDKIINIVASGCREADQMDVDYLNW